MLTSLPQGYRLRPVMMDDIDDVGAMVNADAEQISLEKFTPEEFLPEWTTSSCSSFKSARAACMDCVKLTAWTLIKVKYARIASFEHDKDENDPLA